MVSFETRECSRGLEGEGGRRIEKRLGKGGKNMGRRGGSGRREREEEGRSGHSANSRKQTALFQDFLQNQRLSKRQTCFMEYLQRMNRVEILSETLKQTIKIRTLLISFLRSN